jgi:hypothetical protein
MSSKFKSTFLAILVAVTAALFLLAPVQPARAQLAAFGPIDPVTGFPAFYTDTLGLSLGQCLDGAPNCLPLDGINPTIPLAIPGNFPPEFFYFIAGPQFVDPGANVTVVEFALEGAFATANPPGAVVDGEQSVFQRKRYRLTGLTPPPGQVTIDHPWGTDVLDITADPGNPGFGEVNVTIDVGGAVGLDFQTAVTANSIGPFLTAVAPAPPVGFIGTCAGSQTVTGGPVRNDITITGGGLNLTTDLWDLCGKVFAEPPPQQTGATFSRDNLGAGTVDVTAVAVPAAAVTVDVTGDVTALPGVIEPVPLVQHPVELTSWAVSIPILGADVLPASVTITIDRGIVATETIIPALPVTDKIVGAPAPAPVPIAIFNATDSTLSVNAASSNQRAPLPTLTVTDPAAAVLGTIAGGGTLTVPIATAPATVTITSAADLTATDPAGGTVTIPVASIGAAPVTPPPGGGAVLGGGGGGGGCFINSLLGW